MTHGGPTTPSAPRTVHESFLWPAPLASWGVCAAVGVLALGFSLHGWQRGHGILRTELHEARIAVDALESAKQSAAQLARVHPPQSTARAGDALVAALRAAQLDVRSLARVTPIETTQGKTYGGRTPARTRATAELRSLSLPQVGAVLIALRDAGWPPVQISLTSLEAGAYTVSLVVERSALTNEAPAEEEPA